MAHQDVVATQSPDHPLPLFNAEPQHMPIADLADVIPYCASFLSALSLHRIPRDTALLHACRAIQTLHTATVIGTGGHPFSPTTYGSMRSGQDTARYLIYDLLQRCPPGGKYRLSTRQEVDLARSTCQLYADFSQIHDAVKGTEMGQAKMEINHKKRIIAFEPTDRAHIDQLRIHGKVTARRQSAIEGLRRVLGSEGGAGFMATMDRILDTLDCSSTLGTAFYDFTPAQLKVVSNIVADQWQEVLTGPGLPHDWKSTAFSTSDFRAFWMTLQALASIRELALTACSERFSYSSFPYNSSVLTFSAKQLFEHVLSCAELSISTAKEIAHDLTYDPENVKWTEVQYQPIIPVSGDRYLIIPLVVTANNFERNYSAIIDRIPWRRDDADSLKQSREGQMLKKLVPVAESCGFPARERLRLGKPQSPEGDVDLLLWDKTGLEIMVASLKWFYGPDSVQEVSNHAERYRQAFKQLQRNAEYLRDNLHDFATRYSLDPPIAPQAEIFPVLVLSDDLPLDQDRIPAIPCVTQEEFGRILIDSDGSLKQAFSRMGELSCSVPDMQFRTKHEDVVMGQYTFRLPVAYVGED